MVAEWTEAGGADVEGERYSVGVDGGGTRSRALVGDAEGRELGRAEGGPGLILASEPAVAVRSVEEVVREAAADAAVALPVEALWAGLAGAGNERARALAEAGLAESGVARRVTVGSDVTAAHAAAFGDGPGVVLVAGTGCALRAVEPGGRTIRVGGWGALLGDEFGGYGIALAALRAALGAADGREAPTVLTDLLGEATGCDDARRLAAWGERAAKHEIAALAGRVVRVGLGGDLVAAKVVAAALAEVRSHLAAAMARTSGWTLPTPVALVGGLIRPGGPLREAVAQAVEEMGCAVHPGEVAAERGALLLARGTLD